MSLLLVLGTVLFCRIPYLARGSDVKASDVAIRCLDWHQAEPFYLIEGYDEAVAKAAIPWKSTKYLKKIASEQMKPNGYRHVVYDYASDRPLYHVASTTPHTRLTRAQIEEARAGLEKLFDPADRVAWARVLSWGQGLFLRWWLRSFDKADGYQAPVVEPLAGTEDEQIWFAWQRLTAGGAATPGDLPRLAQLVRQAYPEQADYEAAMAWARNFQQRRQSYYRAWLTRKRQQSPWETRFYGPTAVPPAVDTTLWWILYQYVGLTDESRAAARQRWLHFFPHHEAVALHWGRQLEQQRRESQEPLPPSSDNVALVCVMERLSGWDDYGAKTRHVALQALDPAPGSSLGSFDLFLQTAISVAYPANDIFLLLASGDALHLGTMPGWDLDRSTPGLYGAWLAGWLLFLAVFLFMLRCAVLDVLGGRLLFMRNHDCFRAYYHSQTTTNLNALAIGVIAVPLAKWGWEWWKLAPPNQLLMPTPFHLLAGVYMGVLAGGLMILVINRLVAVLLIRLGFDIEKTWLDEIIGTSLGTLLLAYFGNSGSSLVAFAAVAVLPQVFKRWWKKRHPSAAPADQLAHPQPIMFDTYPVAAWLGLLLGLVFAGVFVFTLFFERGHTSLPAEGTGAPVTICLTYPANAGWMATGIHIEPDTIVEVKASGTVEAAPANDGRAYYHGVPPRGREPSAHFPHPQQPGLALLGKVNADVILIGEHQRFTLNQGSGELFLGINDDTPADNSGAWQVEILLQPQKP